MSLYTWSLRLFVEARLLALQLSRRSYQSLLENISRMGLTSEGPTAVA
jgi:hypothetical protein